jgi:hypothetical protein
MKQIQIYRKAKALTQRREAAKLRKEGQRKNLLRYLCVSASLRALCYFLFVGIWISNLFRISHFDIRIL